jgi:predicted TIM-barrel fold metal-dependent hydrolase
LLIDAHNHPHYYGYSGQALLQNMDEQGIDKMWLLSWEIPQEEYQVRSYQHQLSATATSGIPLDDVVDVSREAPERFVLGYAPHPKRPDAIGRIRAAVDIYGIRLAGEYKSRTAFDDPDSIQLLRVFGELGLPVTIHLQYPVHDERSTHPRGSYWYGGTIGALERAVIACPETVFIGHGQGWWAHISDDDLFDKEHYPEAPTKPEGRVPEMLDRYPNMYADLSAQSGVNALRRDESYGKQFLIDHQDKLLWARDLFDTRLMDHIDKLALPKSVFDKLTYLNAQKLIGES